MPRLLIHVEGQTEESFVNEILRDHLVRHGYHAVEARLSGNARLRERRGGIRSSQSARADIMRHLKGDPSCIASTMVDYYGLPQGESRAWPGRLRAATLTMAEKAHYVENAVRADINAAMGSSAIRRFIPFVVMHEFEALLFSDCAAFSRGLGRPGLAAPLQAIRDDFLTPEEINDSSLTAPSKRVETLMPGYQKPLHGTLAAFEIGLAGIRTECPHFNEWLIQLESAARCHFEE